MSTYHSKIMFLLDGDYLEEQQVPQIYPETLFFGEEEDSMSYPSLPEIGSLFNEPELKMTTSTPTTVANANPYSTGLQPIAVDTTEKPQYLDMDSIDQSMTVDMSCLSPPSQLPHQQQQQAAPHMFPPMDIPSNPMGFQEMNPCDPMEQVKTWAVSQAVEDMHYACNLLHISPDPHAWNPREVHCWVQWALQKNGVQPEHAHNFQMMDGTTLCMLSENDFKMRSPEAGSILCVQLEIWKGAFQHSSMNNVPQFTSQYPPQLLDSASSSSSFTDASSISWAQLPNCDGFYQQSSAEPPFSPRYDAELSPASSCSSLDTAPCPEAELMGQANSDTQNEIPEVTGERTKHNIHLWQFLKELLQSPYHYQNCIRWVDRHQGIFKIEDSARVARLWGKRKNRPAMNYDKLSRSIRQYYKKGIIQKTEHSKRLVYQFCKPYLV